jgi:membrane protease subunit (stomatin/prohibitin family)
MSIAEKLKIADVIKYEGDNKTLIWKFPTEDFNTTSQLIVHESQEAIFFMNGQALDLFGPGRYPLETQNIPVIRRLMSLPTGGVTPFHCEVYFINKVEQLAIKWGTNTKVQYVDPEYGFPLSIGASGEMGIRVENSRKLLVKIVGTESVLSQDALMEYFRAFLNTRIKTYLAREMKEKSINIFEVDSRLVEFSDDIRGMLIPDFDDYGVALERFFVTAIVKPDGDQQYEEFKSLHFRQFADIKDAQIRQQVGVIDQETTKKQTVIEAEGIAQKRQIEGYTYREERGYDVAEKVAQNEGVGEFSNMGIGLGMVAGIGGGIGSTVGGVVNNAIGPVIPDGNPPAAAPGPPGSVGGQGSNQLETPAARSAQDSAGSVAGSTQLDTSVAPAARQVRYCDNCGKEIPPGAIFCEECGNPVPANSCAGCGFVFERPGRFCPKCGAEREE